MTMIGWFGKELGRQIDFFPVILHGSLHFEIQIHASISDRQIDSVSFNNERNETCKVYTYF